MRFRHYAGALLLAVTTLMGDASAADARDGARSYKFDDLNPLDERSLSIPVDRSLSRVGVDIVWAFDVSASMREALEVALPIWSEFKRDEPSDWRNAVISFSDYSGTPRGCVVDGGRPYGAVRDFPSQVLMGFGASREYASQAQLSLTAMPVNNGDTAEAYWRAINEGIVLLNQATAGPGENRRRFVVVFGDDVPHEIDPGPDESCGTADDLFEPVIQKRLRDGHISLIMVLASHKADVASYWLRLAKTIDAAVMFLDSADVARTLLHDLGASDEAPTEAAIEVTTEPPEAARWLSGIPGSNFQRSGDFVNVSITVPPGTSPGEYRFRVLAAQVLVGEAGRSPRPIGHVDVDVGVREVIVTNRNDVAVGPARSDSLSSNVGIQAGTECAKSISARLKGISDGDAKILAEYYRRNTGGCMPGRVQDDWLINDIPPGEWSTAVRGKANAVGGADAGSGVMR